MVPAPFKVVLDANVIFPPALRDTLLRAAARGLYQVRWSDRILDEVARNLVKKGKEQEKVERLVQTMREAFPEARIDGYEEFVPAMKNNEKDRHVAAAALKAGAQVIVTSNLRDFRDLPEGIEAQSPDEFLCGLLDLDSESMWEVIRQQAEDLKNPPLTVSQVLEILAKVVPEFVAGLQRLSSPG